MFTSIDRQLAQVRTQERLQQAAEARANRQAKPAGIRPAAAKLTLAFAALLAVAWIAGMLLAG